MRKTVFILLLITSPIWIIGISARIVFNDWFIEFEYSKKDFPKDRYGLDNDYRKYLAKIGLKAVLSKEGLKKFEETKFPNGRKAFRDKEVKHMADVNKLLSFIFPLSYTLFFFWIIGVFYLEEYREKLLIGSGLITVFLILISGIFTFTNYNKAFELFHNYVFDTTSWKFKSYDTLLRIYPMKFWFDGTVAVVVISFILSLTLITTGAVYRKNA